MQRKSAGQRLCLYNSEELAAIVHIMAARPRSCCRLGRVRWLAFCPRLLQQQLAQLSGQIELPPVSVAVAVAPTATYFAIHQGGWAKISANL